MFSAFCFCFSALFFNLFAAVVVGIGYETTPFSHTTKYIDEGNPLLLDLAAVSSLKSLVAAEYVTLT